MAFYSKRIRNILFYAMIGKKMKVSGHFWAKDSGVCEKGQTILPLYVTCLTWLDPACKYQHSDPITCYKIHRLCTLPFKVSLGTPMERNRKRRAKSPSLAGSASPLLTTQCQCCLPTTLLKTHHYGRKREASGWLDGNILGTVDRPALRPCLLSIGNVKRKGSWLTLFNTELSHNGIWGTFQIFVPSAPATFDLNIPQSEKQPP